jgi:predicted transcriptional regulator
MQDRRLAVALGCERAHAERICYAEPFNLKDPEIFHPIGISCHVCPRKACTQRAHQPLNMKLGLDADRRGSTRYES